MDPFMQFAFVAAEEALKNSELSIESESDRIGIVMGLSLIHIFSALATARIEGLVSESKHSATSPFPLRYSIFTLRYLLLFPVQTHTSVSYTHLT